MSIDTSEYSELRARLKGARPKVARGIRKALREIGKPLGEVVVQEGADEMPSSGGLAAHLRANGRASVSLLAMGIRLNLSSRYSLRRLEEGNLRHPVWGNRAVWVDQGVPAGAWSSAFKREAPQVRDEMQAAVGEILREVLA